MDALAKEILGLCQLALAPASPPPAPSAGEQVEFSLNVLKANDEEQTLTGIVLEPETVDAHGDIYSVEVVRKAAHAFLAGYNVNTKLGTQHKKFGAGVYELVESYLVPLDQAIGDSVVKAGTWVITVHVLDSKTWKSAKDGKLTGFSIGGRAKAVDLQAKGSNFA